MFQRLQFLILGLAIILSGSACQRNILDSPTVAPSALRDVPALRLNYRFESDVPPPAVDETEGTEQLRNEAVQMDFDQNRPQDILDKTLASPNGERVLAIYHSIPDLPAEFRLDMYSADGKLLKKITHSGMAVHFPDTILWSPDSVTLAFVAMVRTGKPVDSTDEEGGAESSASPTPEETAEIVSESGNENANTDANPETVVPESAVPGADEPAPVLTFRTEQIYLCDSNGGDLKPITQNEGLIYFYFVWAPDSSALAALAAKSTEWRIFKYQADQSGQIFIPAGRPRIVEKTGRQRLLDDFPTQVHPVWSPDSAKVAAAFDKQVRIYDAVGNTPTQAAIMLRNELLISSKVYDDTVLKQLGGVPESNVNAANQTANKPANSSNTAPVNMPEGALPDPGALVSFSPIVTLKWPEDAMLYLETAFVRRFKDSTNSVRSNARWHRLIFSPQPTALGN